MNSPISWQPKIFHKYLLSISFIFLSIVRIYCQSVPTDDTGDRLSNMDILPPSPAMANIGNFSRPDVGLISGTAKFHIPLTQINLGSFKLPIALNYSSNGVKVDEISGRVGMGFQLDAGGAITRVISGKSADEYSDYLAPPTDALPTSRAYIDYLTTVYPGTSYELEPDIFTYSFNGVYGKFILDENRNILQLPKTNVEIISDFGGSSWNIKINDPQGNEYYFGGADFVENSKKLLGCGKTHESYKPTAWYLQKIILYAGDTINFNYNSVNYEYTAGRTQTMYYQIPAQSQQGTMGYDCLCPVYQDQNCTSIIDVNTKYLTSIKSSRGDSITFNYTSRSDYGDVLLNRITSYLFNQRKKSYSLSYGHYVNRYFLESITQLTSSEMDSIQLYEMEYDDPQSLPSRMSYAQDEWGYYNGQTSNSTLIQPPNNPDIAALFPYATADRSVDTVLAKKGTLVKLTYPTGGYDKIVYESNTVYTSHSDPPPVITVYDYVRGTNNYDEVSKNLGTITIAYNQTLELKVRNTNMTGNFPSHRNVAELNIISNTNQLIGGVGSLSGNDLDEYNENTISLSLDPGEYTIILKASGDLTRAEGYVTYKGISNSTTQNFPVGGVRVGQIETHSKAGKLMNKKSYLYHAVGSSVSSGVEPNKFIYEQTKTYENYCNLPGDDETTSFYCVSRTCSYQSLFSSSLTTIYNQSGNSVSYPIVLEAYDNEAGSGLISHKFNIREDQNGENILGSVLLGASPTNTSIFNNGQEQQTTLYKKEADQFIPLKTTKYYYSTQAENYDRFNGYIINKLYNQCASADGDLAEPFEVSPWEVTHYFIFSPWLTMDSLVEEDFSNQGELLIKRTAYQYDNQTLLPSIMTTQDSKGRTVATYSYYSGMGNNIPGITTSQLNYVNDMSTNKNLVGQLMYQYSTIDGSFNNSYRVTLDDQISPIGTILPEKVTESYVEGVEGKTFSIRKYDKHGNITEKVTDDGVSMSYLWDYKSRYPVAEIKGTSQDNVAYTSFETTNGGNWQVNGTLTTIEDPDSPSGSHYVHFSTSGSLQFSGWDPDVDDSYIVSYWYKPGSIINVTGGSEISVTPGRNGWLCAIIRVADPSVISVNIDANGDIDNIRAHPEHAMMVTYTYEPGVGISTVSDPNNIITYYSYDAFDRLESIFDSQGNLLNNYKYYFKNKGNL